MAEPHRHLSTMTTELPPDIILYNILPRLPAKSLLRFKSVSKEWHAFLKTPLLAQMHLHHATNDHHQNHHKQLVSSDTTPSAFHTMDCEAPEDGLTTSRPLPFETTLKNMTILTSFGGLVCVGIKDDRHSYRKYSDLILWNPLTNDYKTLSKVNSHNDHYCKGYGIFSLYYSSCDDDYKLLYVSCDWDAYIYSLRSDSWRKIDNHLKRHRVAEQWCSSTVLNEQIYIISYVNELTKFWKSYQYSVLIMFDTKIEKFTEISTPSIGKKHIFCMCVTVLRGCIHLYMLYSDYHGLSLTELSRMDEDRDWKKVVTYPKPGLGYSIIDEPLHLMRNRELLTHSTSDAYVCKLVSTFGVKKISWSDHHIFYIPKRGNYIETLVSPNRSIDEVRHPL